MNVQERIISMTSWVANVPPARICPSTSLKDDLNLDSIDLMLLIVKLEKWFNVTLTSDEVENIETVKDASDYINRYLVAA